MEKMAETKMVRWSLGVTRVDRIRNRYITWTAGIAKLGDELRGLRLIRYGHVRRKKEQYVGRKVLGMALPGRRRRGRPKRRWMDVVREDMRMKGVV